jgi:energy-converting hydrogenase Eha subunit C
MSLDPFLLWLESTPLSVWMREEPSIWAFPFILSLHTIGLGFVAGINAVIALRILGVGGSIPIVELRRFLPVMWASFWLNAISGVLLLIGYPTKALTNPVFYLKLLLIAAGVVLARFISTRVFVPDTGGEAAATRMRPMAWAALVCWAGAIVAGRLLAYTHSRLMQGM